MTHMVPLFLLACGGVALGSYGLVQALKDADRSFFVSRHQAENCALVSIYTIVIGCVVALISLSPFILKGP